jgi:hypothetical protein
MDSHSSATDRPVRIPPIVWFLGLGLIAALAAIFIFNVAASKVAYYGFLAFAFGGHFFMHGSHGAHGSHDGQNQSGAESNSSESNKGEQPRHTGGCH